MRKPLAKYVKFCVVGGSGVFVDMGVIYLLAGLGEWNATGSKIIAAEVALFNNFIWNDLWTFRGEGERRWRAWFIRLGKFNLICAAGIGLSVLLLHIQVYALGINLYAANFIAIVIASIWNFQVNSRFSWRAPTGPADAARSRSPRHEPPRIDTGERSSAVRR